MTRPLYEIAADVLKLIPADAAVSASTTLNPHLSQRRARPRCTSPP